MFPVSCPGRPKVVQCMVSVWLLSYTNKGHISPKHTNELKKKLCFLLCVFCGSRYGLGSCYLRMSKLKMAEYHFRKASSIHPQNAVLLGCVGMVSPVQFLIFYSQFADGIITSRLAHS